MERRSTTSKQPMRSDPITPMPIFTIIVTNHPMRTMVNLTSIENRNSLLLTGASSPDKSSLQARRRESTTSALTCHGPTPTQKESTTTTIEKQTLTMRDSMSYPLMETYSPSRLRTIRNSLLSKDLWDNRTILMRLIEDLTITTVISMTKLE